DLNAGDDPRRFGGLFQSITISDFAGYELPARIDFGATGNGTALTVSGWASPDPGFTWTVGKKAVLRLPLIPNDNRDLKVTLSASPFLSGEILTRQIIIVRSGGEELTRWNMDHPDE